MQDRPNYDELLAAVEGFLEEEIIPNIEGARRFHARVAANTLRIVRRELEQEEQHLEAEWSGLDALLSAAQRPRGRAAVREALAARNEELCRRIREGEADAEPFREAVLRHVRRTLRDKLLVSNPGWLGEGPSDES